MGQWVTGEKAPEVRACSEKLEAFVAHADSVDMLQLSPEDGLRLLDVVSEAEKLLSYGLNSFQVRAVSRKKKAKPRARSKATK